MISDKGAVLSITLPVDLRKRAHVIAKSKRTSTAQLIRDALSEKLDAIEAKQREDDARARREKDERRSDRRLRSLEERVSSNSLAPAAPAPLDEARSISPGSSDDVLYDEHAKKIFETLAANNHLEKRVRISEAINAVKNKYPLTHPRDEEIMVRLEQRILKLQADQPAAPPAIVREPPPQRMSALDMIEQRLSRAFDGFTGKTIDPAKVKSDGDIAVEPANGEA